MKGVSGSERTGTTEAREWTGDLAQGRGSLESQLECARAQGRRVLCRAGEAPKHRTCSVFSYERRTATPLPQIFQFLAQKTYTQADSRNSPTALLTGTWELPPGGFQALSPGGGRVVQESQCP